MDVWLPVLLLYYAFSGDLRNCYNSSRLVFNITLSTGADSRISGKADTGMIYLRASKMFL